jgi:hypothetical protein
MMESNNNSFIATNKLLYLMKGTSTQCTVNEKANLIFKKCKVVHTSTSVLIFISL